MTSDNSAFPCRGKGSFFRAAEHLHFHRFSWTENVLGEDTISVFKNTTQRLDIFVNERLLSREKKP